MRPYQKIIRDVLLYLIGFAVVGIFAFSVIVQWPRKTFVISAISVESSTILPGGQVYWTSTTCKYTAKPYTVTRTLTNSTTGRFYTIDDSTVGPTQSQIPLGKCGDAHLHASVPDNVPPGDYTLTIHIETQVNRWNSEPTVRNSNHFTVSAISAASIPSKVQITPTIQPKTTVPMDTPSQTVQPAAPTPVQGITQPITNPPTVIQSLTGTLKGLLK